MRFLSATSAAVCLAALLHAQGQVDNPFVKCKVGDWAEYKLSGHVTGKTKMTVVSKGDRELVYEITGSVLMDGKELTPAMQRQMIDLTRPYDPIAAANTKAEGVKSEKVEEGNEKIRAGEVEFHTTWIKIKTTATVRGATVVSDGKMWFAKDAPLSGLVKMEMTTSGVSNKMELVGSGSK